MAGSKKPDAVFLPDGRRAQPVRAWARELVLAIPNLAKLLGRLAVDDRVPAGKKRLAGFVAAYLVSPVDVLPDFLPLVGKTDDVLIAAYAVSQLVRSVGADVVREHWDGSDEVLDAVIDVVDTVVAWIPGPVRLGLNRLTRLRVFGR